MRSRSFVLSASILGLCFTAAACGGTGTGAAGTSSGSGGEPTGGGGRGGQASTTSGMGGDVSTTTSAATTTTGAGGGSAASSSSTGMAPCPAGTIDCMGNVQTVCDGNGGVVSTDCGAKVCVPQLGCLACAPGTGTCNGNLGTSCLGDGSGTATEVCDPVQGTTCNAQTGHFDGACGAKAIGKSYIGCDYFPTVTANLVGTQFHFAVAVSNTTANSAAVTVTQGNNTISTVMVAANSVQVITLPCFPELTDAEVEQVCDALRNL